MQLSIKYRPYRFSDVVGQDSSIRIMTNSILMNRIPKSFLISGLHGSGKTTLARIYASALNCDNYVNLGDVCELNNPHKCSSCVEAQNGSHLSIIELDAASNNGVEDIRNLEKILFQKVIHKYRVIILDEVHMLSKQAQAALLKILEELPDNNIFFLVTTEPEKLEKTIRSRCLSLPLRPVHPNDLAINICKVLDKEGKVYEKSFVDTLSLYGGGSVRDILQLLEQMIISAGSDPLSMSLLENTVGIISTERYKDLASVIINKDAKYALDEINRWYEEGEDLELVFITGIPNLIRDFMICLSNSYSNKIYLYSGLSIESLNKNLNLTNEEILKINEAWNQYYYIVKNSSNSIKVVIEAFFAYICILLKPF